MEAAMKTLKKEIGSGTVLLRNVKNALLIIAKEAKNRGLSNRDMAVLVSLFDTNKRMKVDVKHSTVFIMALTCMLPRTRVPDDIIRQVVLWIVIKFRYGPVSAVAYALRWVAGLLSYDLASKKILDIFYEHFMEMMGWKLYETTACWLVHKLTQPRDVERSRVLHLLRLQKHGVKSTDIVLWLFKIYKPECVPEPVSSRSVGTTLSLPTVLKVHFERTQEQVAGLATERTLNTTYEWIPMGSTKRRKLQLIPGIFYNNFGSSLARAKKISLLELTGWKDMAKGQLTPDVPSRSLALLQNPLGHYIIATDNSGLQHRLSYNLFYTLHTVFIERSVVAPLSEQEQLLEKLCELQEFMLQGLPVTARFLALYIVWWDGRTHLAQILRLIEWLPVSSYAELHKCILDHLYIVFMSSPRPVKKAILQALGNLATNLMLHSKRDQHMFLSMEPTEELEDTVKPLVQFVQNLCVKGLIVEGCPRELVMAVLLLHKQLNEAEEQSGLPVWSVLPPIVVYSALFSLHYPQLNMVAELLHRYKESTYPKLKAKYPRVNFVEELKLLNLYVSDFMNILWTDQSFKKRRQGYAFKDVDKKSIMKFFSMVQNIQVFNLAKHPMVSLAIPSDNKSQSMTLAVLKHIAPSVYQVTSEIYQRSE